MKNKELPKVQVVIYKPKWLSLNQMADVVERDKPVVSRHLNNIFKSKELDRD